MGVIAQTTPAVKPAPVDPKTVPAKQTSAPAKTGKENKASGTIPKKSLKKTLTNKKGVHHITPVKKPTPATQTNKNKQDSKK